MKILWLYKYVANYNFDKWLHLEYVRSVKKLGYDIVAYGPGLEIEYSDIMLTPYNPDLSWDQILSLSQADITILNTRSRAFEYYNPFTGEKRGCWLPKGFDTSRRVRKVLIDEDSHYEKDDYWVESMGFSLTLQRHKAQADRKDWRVKTLWLPFSVNIDIFNNNNNNTTQRQQKICFTGSMTGRYSDRIRAIELLNRHNLIDTYPTGVKVGDDYTSCLRKYVGCLSGASDYDICAAKNLEIMASGAVLLTNTFTGLDDLFPDTDTYSLYTNNSDDIILKATEILYEPEYAIRTSRLAMEHIQKNHTDAVRTKQLIEILKKEE